MNIRQSIIFLISLFISLSTSAASKWAGDWFEIEVILLSQLTDKSTLKEVFPDNDFSLDDATSRDLLKRYLNPDIASLKQQLPICNLPFESKTYLEQVQKWPEFYASKSIDTLQNEVVEAELERIKAIEAEAVLNAVSSNEISTDENGLSLTSNNESNDTLATKTAKDYEDADNAYNNSDDFFDRVQTAQERNEELTNQLEERTNNFNQSQSLANQEGLNVPGEENQFDTTFTQTIIEEKPITEEQLILVQQAEEAFSAYQFNYVTTYPINNEQQLCILSEAEFLEIAKDNQAYKYNGFTVKAMPKRIDAAEDLLSEVPYLISNDSLKLSNIVTKLRRSKNFKPLLHVGWRQPVFEKFKSQPMKLYAGDNLEAAYRQSLKTFNQEKEAALQEELRLSEILNNNLSLGDSEANENTNELGEIPLENLEEQLKKQRLIEIIEQTENILDIATVIEQIEQSSLDNNLSNELTIEAPTPPIQPWFLEGLLDVYLIGNFLNVDANFSMVDLTLAEQETLKLASNTVKTKKIRLQQKRRLISRETHYFDHPYMGVIVQIRRHKKPETELEIPEEVNQ